jgi:hypothetical protein
VAVAGWTLGSIIGTHRAESVANEYRSQLQQYLQDNVRGLEVGEGFPDIPVSAGSGDQEYSIHSLLPDGGLIVLIGADCPTCIEAVTEINDAISQAGVPPQQVVLLADHNRDIERLLEEMAQRGITLPVYCDVQRTLRKDYHIATNPTFFRLNDQGALLEFGPLVAYTPEQLNELLHRSVSVPLE